MKWQPEKPNTKPIFILPKNTNIKPKFRKIVLNMTIKYQDNTKNFGTEVPNTDLVLAFSWSWYTKFLVTDWHPGPLTRSHSLTVTFTTDVPHTTAHYRGLRPNPRAAWPADPSQVRSGRRRSLASATLAVESWGAAPHCLPPPGSHVPVAQPLWRTMSNARPHITYYFGVGGGGKRLPGSRVTPTQN